MPIRQTAAVERIGIVGFQPQGLIVIRDGVIIVPLVLICPSPVVERISIARFQPQGLIVVVNGMS